jgi:UDP-glucose 4-epimerase
MRAFHVDGTRRLVSAARNAGVRRFVLVSTALVYGARPENPVPLTEDAPVAPLEGFAYAVDKAAQEEVLRAEAGELSVAIARPAMLYGARGRNHLAEMLRWAPGVLPSIDGHTPPFQLVHVDDAGAALAALVGSSERGAFNVCTPDWITYDDVANAAGLRIESVPRWAMAPVLVGGERRATMSSAARAPEHVLTHLMHPVVMSSARLEGALGFRARSSSADILGSMLRRTRATSESATDAGTP